MIAFPAKLSENCRAVRLPRMRSALAGLLAVGILTGLTSVASATCGDWLANPGHSMAGNHSAVLADLAKNHDLAGQLPAKAPCKGPMCQKRPAAPAPTVPTTVLERIDKLGIAIHSEMGDLLLMQFALAPESDVHPAKGFLPRIEHPPRV
ncbi:MAG: hypothetical protein WD669_10495 [Pirellulales bacterium]